MNSKERSTAQTRLEYEVQYRLNNIIEAMKADGITDIGRAQGKYGDIVASTIRKGVTEAYDIGADYTDSQFNFFGVTEEELNQETITVKEITNIFIIKFWRKISTLMHRNDTLLQKYDFEPRSELNSNYMATSTAIGLITRGMAYGTVNKVRHLQQFRVTPLKSSAFVDEGERDETVDQLVWNAVGDNNTCDSCAELDGEYFDYDDPPIPSEICDGGDNCRCTLDIEPATSMVMYSDEEDELEEEF